MVKLCVFAGTTEGRRLERFLSGQDAEVCVCAATEYGGELLSPAPGVRVLTGRMDKAQMEEFIKRERFDAVLDATHPYASAVTENISAACAAAGTEYLRIERSGGETAANAVRVPDTASAVKYLNGTSGRILLTTGSKEISAFAGVDGFSERVFARVLPSAASIEACTAAGLAPSHVFAMQGPFSEDMNRAMIKAADAAYVVTKDSGRAGGFLEKARAAEEAGAVLVVIGRPAQPAEGMSLEEAIDLLSKRYGFKPRQRVCVAGVGPGPREGMTEAVLREISDAECVIGAARMLECARPDQTVFEAVSPVRIAEFIRTHREFERFAVLMSGDVGFYSGAKKLLPLLDFCECAVRPGVSSLAYLCAAAGESYEDTVCVSLHGREQNAVQAVRTNASVFVLVGGENGAGRLMRELAEAGLGEARAIVGERLGYPDERITRADVHELCGRGFDPLSAVLIKNPAPESAAFGLPDETFIRSAEGRPVVPMTKSEVRAVIMSKLGLTRDSVAWDVGAGTGSVTAEMASASPGGMVYAIEKNPEAVDVLRANTAKFGLKNVSITEGEAPGICRGLPAPTHAFIGGSSGNVRDIVELLLGLNPEVRIVAAAVTLGTVSELSALLDDPRFKRTEAVCVQVSRARKLGQSRLMTAQNPVYVFTFNGR